MYLLQRICCLCKGYVPTISTKLNSIIMRNIILISFFALCSTQFCKAQNQDDLPLKDESNICIIFDFSHAEKINKLPYAYYEEDPSVLNGFAKGVIGFFNAKSKTLKSTLIQENKGEKYDLVFVVKKVDPDGETDGDLFLKEHESGHVVAVREGINVNGGRGWGFVEQWNAACEKLAKRFVSFTKIFTGEK